MQWDNTYHLRSGKPHELLQYINQLTLALEGTSAPFASLHTDGRIVSCNKAFADLIGYSKAEICELSWKNDLTPREYLELTESQLENLHRNKTPIKYEKEYQRKDGSRVYLEFNVHLLSDEAGMPVYYFLFVNDLTSRKSLERNLLDNDTAFNLAQGMAHLGNWYYDMAERKVYWSDEFYSILGFKPGECKPDMELFLRRIHPEDQSGSRGKIQEVIETGKPGYMECRIIRDDGTVRYLNAKSQALRDAGGRLVRIYWAIQDVTDYKLSEVLLEDAKDRAEFYVDLLSHDINNMNQVAIGYIEMALKAVECGNFDPSLLAKTVELLFNSSALIENVRIIQRIKSGEIKPERIDLCLLLTEVIRQYSSVRGREVMINHRFEGNAMVIASELLREVFSNLISNAIKHSTGKITINVDLLKIFENEVEFCKVIVTDDGPGIPDEKKKELFTRYTRGPTKAKGSGLGLYIVKSLVETFKGQVWVEDRVSGDHTRGSRFIVLLPTVNTRSRSPDMIS